MIFSYSGQFFILPDPAFAICDFGGGAGALASEDWGKTGFVNDQYFQAFEWLAFLFYSLSEFKSS